MAADDRIRIETLTKTPTATNPSGVSVSSSDTRWCEAVVISPAAAVQRYGVELDKVLRYEFRFFDRPTITLKNTRFVWMSDDHPNELKIYRLISTAINVDGVGERTTVLVEETGETASS